MKTWQRLKPAFALAGVLFSMSAWADELYVTDPISGCRIWTDETASAGEAVSWDGECVGGKSNGSGTLSWFRGGKLRGRYEGGMAYGRLHGGGRPDSGGGRRL